MYYIYIILPWSSICPKDGFKDRFFLSLEITIFEKILEDFLS